MPKRDATHMESQRERIMRAALFCISKNGVERTSVADIWRKAGLSAGALYVHFKSKDDIVSATLVRFSTPEELPQVATWNDLKALTLASADMGSDPELEEIDLIRARIYLLADAARSDVTRGIQKVPLQVGLKMVARLLEHLSASGEIELTMTPIETASALAAFNDGMRLQGLALDRPINETSAAIARGMDLFVKLPS